VAEFSFESSYDMIGDGAIVVDRYVMLRQPFGSWTYATGTNISTGECGYHYEAALASNNNRCRAGVRFRGAAHNSNCSGRYVNSYSSVVICSATTGGSAQVLLDLESEAPPQAE
jgi:hypothetical protein